MSLDHSGPILCEWRDSEQLVGILFQDSSAKSGWQRNGRISSVGLTEFEIRLNDGGLHTFKYDVLTTIDGSQLRFLYPSGEKVVVHEVSP